MVEEVAGFLGGFKEGVILDLTCGGGGHLNYLSGLLAKEAHLIGIDRDIEAVASARDKLKTSVQGVIIKQNNFSRFEEVLDEAGYQGIDGVLMDLGISSHQIDTAGRGFSFGVSGPLDMRMDRRQEKGASEIVNSYTYEELKKIFKQYGEDPKAARAARAVVEARESVEITTTEQLAEILGPLYPSNRRNSSLARLFQALRIEVNKELKELEEVLPKIVRRLNKGGRMVVISYHSLEDRIVKRFIAAKSRQRTGPADLPDELFGPAPELKVLTGKVLRPTEEEVNRNSRARSARLRAAEKI